MPLHRGNRLADPHVVVAEGGLVRASIWRFGIAWLVAWAMGCLRAAEPSPASSRPLRVAAASDLTFVMPELNRLFATVHPGQTAETILGASGTLVAQIRKGAPFDVFLSADRRYPEALVADGLAVSNSLTHYASGRVVLWTTRPGLDPREGLSILQDPAVRRLAIANPLHAPYGRAAREILGRADLWGGWSNRVVLGETVAQTAQWVELGTVDLGLVSRSWVTAPRAGQLGRWWEVPADLHDPLDQVAVVTRRGESHPGAELYRNLLRSRAAIGLLERFGFDVPGGNPETTVRR
ncbi:MAG: molybdate ABC transporter substrate-binding protein [Verrucomicrobiota bacterium]